VSLSKVTGAVKSLFTRWAQIKPFMASYSLQCPYPSDKGFISLFQMIQT